MASEKDGEKKSKYIYILLAAMVIIISFFIPFPKETFLDDDSKISSFSDIVAYKAKLYKSYRDTGEVITILKLMRPDCDTHSTGYGIVSNCEEMYIHNGKIYDTTKFDDEFVNTTSFKYLDEVSYQDTYGSTIDYETYYTVNCYLYGLLCMSGNTLDDYKKSHTRIRVGNNTKIKFYKTTCDMMSDREMLNGDVCIYADDTYSIISFQELLKKR